MLTKQTSNSAIQSLLNASGKAEGDKPSVGLKGAAFSDILKVTGSLKDLSSEQLMAFFSKSGDKQGEEGEVSELLSKLETPEGRELLKNFKLEGTELKSVDGESVSLKQFSKLIEGDNDSKEKLGKNLVVKKSIKGQKIVSKEFANPLKLENKEILNSNSLNTREVTEPLLDKKPSQLQSAEDFLRNRNAILGNKTVKVSAKGVTLENGTPGLHQYSKETKVFEKNLIRPLKAKRVEKISIDSLSLDSTGPAQVPDSDPMLLAMRNTSSGEGADQNLSGGSAPIMDLSSVPSQNKAELMQKIGQYIENSYVSGSDSLELIVKHDELGQFRINTQKSGPGSQVDLEISTVSEKAHQFFASNEGDLLKALSKSGIRVADFKLSNFTETFKTAFGENRSNMDQGSHSGGDKSGQHFGSGGSFGKEQEQSKRQRIWQEAKEFSERLHA